MAPPIWNSRFAFKSTRHKRAIIREPWIYPLAASNLAAIQVQRIARGFVRRMLPHRQSEKLRINGDETKSKEGKHEEENHDFKSEYYSYHILAAMQVQFTWRAWRERSRKERTRQNKEFLIEQTAAAKTVQKLWRRQTDLNLFKFYKHLVQFNNVGDPKSLLKSINPSEAHLFERASGVHVRFRLGSSNGTFPPNIYYKIYTHSSLCDVGAFAPLNYALRRSKSITNKHLKKETRDNSRPRSSQTLSEESIQLQCASITEKLGVRIRISDESASELCNGAKGWYQRFENNGWRAVLPQVLEDASRQDEIEVRTHAQRKPFHFSKLIRKQEVEHQKRSRKIDWMRKLYMLKGVSIIDSEESKICDESKSCVSKGREERRSPSKLEFGENLFDFEATGDVDQLLEWSNKLDFDEYVDEWSSMGVAAIRDLPEEKHDYEY